MATSYAPLLLQALDDYGELLAGGFIYTYEGGTTTPLVTYQNLSGSVENENPVELDAAGRATVRVTNGVSYKFVITDADLNEIVTLDHIIVGEAAGATGETYLIHMSFAGTPGAQAFMWGHIFSDDVEFPVDLEGWQGWTETAPAAEFIISARLNDVEVGTATIGTDGAFEFETVGHTTVDAVAGDVFALYGPDVVGTATNIVMTGEGVVV